MLAASDTTPKIDIRHDLDIDPFILNTTTFTGILVEV
jgi:hypothetical protein